MIVTDFRLVYNKKMKHQRPPSQLGLTLHTAEMTALSKARF